MVKLFLTWLFIALINTIAISQLEEDRPDYLSIQTGFNINRYNSFGIRTFFEYQKDLKNNWQFGISYEHTRHIGYLFTDLYGPPTNLSQLNINGYYKFNLIKDRLFWTAGFGIGALHLNWDEQDRLGATINASLTLNIRVSKRIYIETSPLIILFPTNRIYYTPLKLESFNHFLSAPVLPIGLKVKI